MDDLLTAAMVERNPINFPRQSTNRRPTREKLKTKYSFGQLWMCERFTSRLINGNPEVR